MFGAFMVIYGAFVRMTQTKMPLFIVMKEYVAHDKGVAHASFRVFTWDLSHAISRQGSCLLLMHLSMMTYLVLQVINSTARLILSIVVQDCVSVCPVKGPLYLQHANIHA